MIRIHTTGRAVARLLVDEGCIASEAAEELGVSTVAVHFQVRRLIAGGYIELANPHAYMYKYYRAGPNYGSLRDGEDES